jgi:CHAT domain-containing protein
MSRFRTAQTLTIASGIALLSIGILTYRYLQRRDSAEEILRKADNLSWNNQWMEATPLYAQAERLFEKENRPSAALYAHVSQFIPRAESEPLPPLLLELQRAESLPGAEFPDTRLRILVIKGMIETNYDASMARTTWQQVEKMARDQGHYLLMARAMGEQGIAAFLLGDFSSAKKLVLRAWFTAKIFHDPAAHVRYASVYGAGLVELQRYDEALQALDEAINTAARSRGVAYPSIAINSKIDALRGLHRYQDALALADAAIRRLPSSSFDAHLFQIYTSKGEIYSDLGQPQDAVAQYNRALAYARQLNYWRGIAQTGGLRAEAYEREDHLDLALASVDEAIHANEQLPQELYYVPHNLAIKARILDKLGHAKESHALFERSLSLIDSLVATAPTPDVERELLTQLGLVYTGYFDSLSKAGDLAGAFGVVEKARGRIEAQALEDHALIQPHEDTPQEKAITQMNLELLESDKPTLTAMVEQEIEKAEHRTGGPTLASIAAKRPLPLQTVQQHLRPNELVLEYVLAEPVSSVLAITHQSIRKYDLASRSAIESDTVQYRRSIRDRKANPALASALFQKLLAPIAEYRNSSSIIVIPDGQLHLLPFSALMDQGSYILTNHVISASPSSTVLCLLRDREEATLQDPLEYVGVAAWQESSTQQKVGLRPVAFFQDNEPQPLPESKVEVESIAQDFPASSTVLVGADATETRFKRLPLVQYRVLHLALHGYVNLQFPDRSALVFASEPGGPDDGLLEVREIRTLRLKARLVTLSACNTGVGPVGEVDVANMGNAFIEAGAESVVSTLWDLQDRTAERIMTQFYQNLALRNDKAIALRDAQLDVAKAGLSPYYWAGFEITGDPAGAL